MPLAVTTLVTVSDHADHALSITHLNVFARVKTDLFCTPPVAKKYLRNGYCCIKIRLGGTKGMSTLKSRSFSLTTPEELLDELDRVLDQMRETTVGRLSRNGLITIWIREGIERWDEKQKSKGKR